MIDDKLQTIDSPGVNIFKHVEMATKYKDIVPLEVWEDKLYIKPDPEAVELVKTEKNRRKLFRGEINMDKKKLQKSWQIRRSPWQRRGMSSKNIKICLLLESMQEKLIVVFVMSFLVLVGHARH